MRNAEQSTSKPLEWPNYGPVNVATPRPASTRPAEPNDNSESELSRRKSSALWSALCTAIAVSMTTGCASSVTVSPSAQVPANLRQPCPRLPSPSDGTGAALLTWVLQVIDQYNDCADRHDRTIEAIGP